MKEEILKLRKEGKSYNEIIKILNCSKAAVSYHCNPKVKENFLAFRRKNRKKQLFELKTLYGGCCCKCGYNKCLNALHFHHTNPENKSGQIANLLCDKGKKIAFEEAKKCILLCANCHAELHADCI